MFDDVLVPCPACGETLWLQSKGASDPQMDRFTPDTAPPRVLADLDGYTVQCPKCERKWTARAHMAVTLRIEEADPSRAAYLSREPT